MKLSKLAICTLVPTVFLVGCGGDERRSTTDSADLTGLWRTTLDSSQIGLTAKSNISYILKETDDGVKMTSCLNRSELDLTKANQQLDGLPVGLVDIDDNDTISGNSDYGRVTGSKMALPESFDMGDITISGTTLGTISFKDICVVSTEAKVLGQTTLEEYYAGVMYRGEPMEIKLTVMGNIGVGTYDVVREPDLGQAGITLKSDGLLVAFNRTEMDLRDGTITISEDGNVYLKGEFSANMPNGNTLSGTFELEKP